MRTEHAITRTIAAVLVGVVLAGAACGSRVDTSTPAPTTTAAAPTTVATTTTTTTSSSAVPTTGAPSTSAAPSTTAAAPPSTRTSVLRSVPPETKKFCDYIASVTLSDIPDTDWTAGYHRVQAALAQAKALAPADIEQAVTDLSTAVDSLQPEVEAKRVTSNAELDAWFAKQDTATRTKVLTSGKQIQIFYDGNCAR